MLRNLIHKFIKLGARTEKQVDELPESSTAEIANANPKRAKTVVAKFDVTDGRVLITKHAGGTADLSAKNIRRLKIRKNRRSDEQEASNTGKVIVSARIDATVMDVIAIKSKEAGIDRSNFILGAVYDKLGIEHDFYANKVRYNRSNLFTPKMRAVAKELGVSFYAVRKVYNERVFDGEMSKTKSLKLSEIEELVLKSLKRHGVNS